MKSGKTKIFWNKRDISHLFVEKQQFHGVQFSWERRPGEKFQVLAFAKDTGSIPQYNLRIGDFNFYSLPHVSELRSFEFGVDSSRPPSKDSKASPKSSTEIGHESGSPVDDQPTSEEPQDVDFRLSMAGLATPDTRTVLDELEDELTADLFTNSLESLRQRVTALIPETEDMVSRSIINAFSEDPDSLRSFGSLSLDSMPQCSIQIETDVIWETTGWITLNVEGASRPEVEEQKRMFLQKQIDFVFKHVRNERLSEDEATTILSSVATLLGTRLNQPITKDTLIINELDKNLDVEALILSLCVYGEVKEAAISGGRGFGVCRFCNEQGLSRALAAAKNGSLLLNGKKSVVSVLEQTLVRDRPNVLNRRVVSEPTLASEKPSLPKQKSDQRNTITVDTLLTNTPHLELVHETPLVTPDESRTTLRPNVFTNIPARTSPLAFDSSAISPEAYRFSPTSMLVME